MSFDDNSLLLRTISPVKQKINIHQSPGRIPDQIYNTGDVSEEENDGDNGNRDNDEDSCNDDSDYVDEDQEDDDDEDDGAGGAGAGEDAKGDDALEGNCDDHPDQQESNSIGMFKTSSAPSNGSISSIGFATHSYRSFMSAIGSAKGSIMNRLLRNITVDPEPIDSDIDDDQSMLSSIVIQKIERPTKRPKREKCFINSGPFPNETLPEELLDDFIAHTKELKARSRYDMGKYSDVTLIIMNYALKKYDLLVEKLKNPEQLNIRWMFEFWRSKEVKLPVLHGGRNEYSQVEELAIERGLYKYPPYEEIDVKGKKICIYRWREIFMDKAYHELLKCRSPQSIKDKARGTRNREGESIMALYHVQHSYRMNVCMLQRQFCLEVKKTMEKEMMVVEQDR